MMKNQAESRTIDLPAPRKSPSFSEALISNELSPAKTDISSDELKTSRRDALSFSVCFAIVAFLTGLMLFYRVAVTISSFTSVFFYSSLAGMLFFAVRAILLSRQRSVAGE